MPLNDAIKTFIVVFIRAALQILAGTELAKGFISPDQIDAISDHLGSVILIGGTVAWSIIEKRQTSRRHQRELDDARNARRPPEPDCHPVAPTEEHAPC